MLAFYGSGDGERLYAFAYLTFGLATIVGPGVGWLVARLPFVGLGLIALRLPLAIGLGAAVPLAAIPCDDAERIVGECEPTNAARLLVMLGLWIAVSLASALARFVTQHDTRSGRRLDASRALS